MSKSSFVGAAAGSYAASRPKKEKIVRAESLSRRVGTVGVGVAVLAFVILAAGPLVDVLGAPVWLAWALVALAFLAVLGSLGNLGLNLRLYRLTRAGIPFAAAWQIAANWRVHCEEAGLYAVKHRGNQQIHRYPTLGALEATPAGVTGIIRTPGAGLTMQEIEAHAPALGGAFGFPVAIEPALGNPREAAIHFSVRDPLEGTRNANI